jgi:PKD repeat protein
VFATNEITTAFYSFNIDILPIPIDGLEAFSSAPTLLGETTYFSVTVSAGGEITYEWDFGDTYTTTTTSQYITHTYQATDVYTVTVMASNRTNNQSDTLQVAVNPYYIYLPMIIK